MGEITGFMKYDRQDLEKEPVSLRIKHWREFIRHLSEEELKTQGARCMDCGTPFCHWACPVGNYIPEWNDLVYRGQWQEALARLMETNNFPEITGRICPAPCEDSCVLAINDPAVTIKNIELFIIEKGYENGWLKPRVIESRTGKTVAVIGSGPAGLACADELNKMGHQVTVYEKNEEPGGILVYGIPDFKLEKHIISRRLDLMREEGIVFKTNAHVGKDISIKYLLKEYDALVLAGGAERPRSLPVPGGELKGVCQAMDYLTQQNRVNRGVTYSPKERITAQGKNVVVLGGGDTGSDCVGTANRQGARSVCQFEILPRPPEERGFDNPWPQWGRIYRKSSSHEEGVDQRYSVMTKSLIGEKGQLKKISAVRLEYGPRDPQTGRMNFKEIPGSAFEMDCDMMILAMGFLGPERQGMLEELDIECDERGNVKTNTQQMTNIPGVFAAGDMRRGQSLIVHAIYEGRRAAEGVGRFLKQT